jgi:hypothetical protein
LARPAAAGRSQGPHWCGPTGQCMHWPASQSNTGRHASKE